MLYIMAFIDKELAALSWREARSSNFVWTLLLALDHK
jgi:hypothetical protein